jgi:hypothetical protein
MRTKDHLNLKKTYKVVFVKTLIAVLLILFVVACGVSKEELQKAKNEADKYKTYMTYAIFLAVVAIGGAMYFLLIRKNMGVRTNEGSKTSTVEKGEAEEVDPLSINRQPFETTFDIYEGQKGISYPKLFKPYLAGAKVVKLVDPYIRFDYQVYNLANFCNFLAPKEGQLELNLVTSYQFKDQEPEIWAKLKELQSSLVKDRIDFTFTFESGQHDRWIETDTGWRIILGRGLDIFQKPETKFSLDIVDQTKRQCKKTRITFQRFKQI